METPCQDTLLFRILRHLDVVTPVFSSHKLINQSINILRQITIWSQERPAIFRDRVGNANADRVLQGESIKVESFKGCPSRESF